MKRLMNILRNSKGFTLVELLVVIAILGILAAGLLIAIDPVERINAANDTKVYNDLGSVARALEAFAANNNGKYPDSSGAFSTDLGALTDEGALKNIPSEPGSYTAYAYTCTVGNGGDCTAYELSGELKSKKNSQPAANCTGADCATGEWFIKFTSEGSSCVVAPLPAVGTACP